MTQGPSRSCRAVVILNCAVRSLCMERSATFCVVLSCRANAVGSAIAKKLTPASRKTVCPACNMLTATPLQHRLPEWSCRPSLTMRCQSQASIAGSPSPSPLRWVSFPVKRGGNIKGVRLFADDRPPVVIPATCATECTSKHASSLLLHACVPCSASAACRPSLPLCGSLGVPLQSDKMAAFVCFWIPLQTQSLLCGRNVIWCCVSTDQVPFRMPARSWTRRHPPTHEARPTPTASRSEACPRR